MTRAPQTKFLAVLACAALLGLAAVAASAQARQQVPGGGPGTRDADCIARRTFTSGSGANLIKFCVSAHGNVVGLETPAGFEHIMLGTVVEGYIICDDLGSSYYDSGGYVESGWTVASTITQPGGPGTLPLTIDRDTSDGLYRLRQSYALSTTRKAVVVTERVFNLDSVRHTLNIQRYVDLDVDNAAGDDVAVKTLDSAAGTNPDIGHALFLTTQHPNYSAGHTTAIESFDSFADGGTYGSCTPADNATPTAFGDWTQRFAFPGRGIGPGNSATLVFVYQRQ